MKSTEDYLDSLLAGAVQKDKDRAAGVSDGSALQSLSSDDSSFVGAEENVKVETPKKEASPRTAHTRASGHKSSEDALDKLLRQAMGQEEPEEPVVEETVIEEPVIETPVVEETVVEDIPVIEEQVITEPVTEQADEYSDFVEATAEEAVSEFVEEPAVEEPVIETPVFEEPVIEEPLIQQTVVEEPIIEEAIVQEPVIEEAATEEESSGSLFGDSSKMMSLDEIAAIIASAGDGLIDENAPANAFDEPVDNIPSLDDDDELLEKNLPEEPVIEETIAEEPIIEEPVIDEGVVEETISDEPIIEEPVIEEPVIEEPVIEETVIDEPIIEEQIAEEPASEIPAEDLSGDDISALLSDLPDFDNVSDEAEVPSDEFGGVDGDLSLEELMPERYDGEETSEPEMFEGDVLSHGMPEADASVIPEENTETISTMEVLDENGNPINEEPEAEKVIADEKAEQEKPADSGQTMSQDDISSLLESMQLDDQDKADIETLEDNVVTVTDEENNEVDIDISSKIPDDISENISFDGVENEMEEIKKTSPAMTDEEADSKADDLMSMLLDEGDGSKEESAESPSEEKSESSDNENFGGIAAQLGDMSEASEEDIEKMLAEAESVDDKPTLDFDGDVTDIVDVIGADGETKEVADLLKSSDQGEIVDESYAEKLEKAEHSGGEAEFEEVEGKGKKRKKKKKKNLFAKLFGKNVDDGEENDEDKDEGSEENPEQAPASVEAGGPKNVVDIESDVEPGAGGTTDDGDIILIPGDEAGEEGAEGAKGKPAKEGGEEKKPEKKKGLFQKILDFLTEEVEEEVEVPEAKDTKLSDENQAILEEIDGEGEDKKGKKKKKEKKPKEEKPKKEKKPKAPKPKKEKLVDPKDKAKAIPKKYIGAIVLMAVSICAILMLVASYMPALMNLSEARDAYYSKNYKDAFYTMYGKDLNESDMLMYEKAKTIVLVDRKYESYENYMLLGMRLEALDALLQGIAKYEEVKEYGDTLGISGELGEIKIKITNALMNEFGVSDEKAHEILKLSALNYSRMLDSILNGTPYISAEDEANALYGLPTSSDTMMDNNSNADDIVPLDQFPDLLPPEEDYLNGQNPGGEPMVDDPLPEEQPAGLDTLTDDQINTFNQDHPETVIQEPEVVIDSEFF